MMLKTLLIGSAILVPAAARAGSVAAQFAAVLEDTGHRATVLAAAKDSPAWQAAACPSASFTEVGEVGVYAPVRFNAQNQPVAGEWREGVMAAGCGRKITLNVLTQVTAPAILATGPLLPGGTIADPVLQNIAQANAVAAAGGVPEGCKNPYIGNTMFSAYEGPMNKALPAAQQVAPWREVWTLNFCGTTKQITMHFTPDATGTNINAVPDG